jgi:hypothetical protein
MLYMKGLYSILLIVVGTLCLIPGSSTAAESLWKSVGLRGGFSDTPTSSSLYQYELFAVYQLPWELRARSGWGVSTGIDVSAGFLSDEGDYGFLASFGPVFGVGKPGFPLELTLGVSAGILGRDTFGKHDYNGKVQFLSHAGLDYRFTRSFGLGYRIQHMSNAGLNGHRNPGVNLQLLSVNYYLGG